MSYKEGINKPNHGEFPVPRDDLALHAVMTGKVPTFLTSRITLLLVLQ